MTLPTAACTLPAAPGTSGWHTHALDYAVESMEPHCLFRVMRDGPRMAFASLAADGHLLCATSGSGDRLGLAPCSGGGSWAAAGASWEQKEGAICNSRWPDKARGGWTVGRLLQSVWTPPPLLLGVW